MQTSLQSNLTPHGLSTLEILGQLAQQRHSTLATLISAVPRQPQRQDSTVAQLRDLRVMANRMGMYDAADTLRNLIDHEKPTKPRDAEPPVLLERA